MTAFFLYPDISVDPSRLQPSHRPGIDTQVQTLDQGAGIMTSNWLNLYGILRKKNAIGGDI